MIILSNTTTQVILPGQSITFDTVVLHTGDGECHRPGTSSVKMKARGIYEINFGANIASGDTGNAELAIQIGGETLPETRMIESFTSATQVRNVSTRTAIKNCCCDYDRLTVVNVGTTSVTIGANPVFYVKRVS